MRCPYSRLLAFSALLCSPRALAKPGSNSSKQSVKPTYETQNRPKRTNHIALVSLPWAQEVRGSNPRAPTKLQGGSHCYHSSSFPFREPKTAAHAPTLPPNAVLPWRIACLSSSSRRGSTCRMSHHEKSSGIRNHSSGWTIPTPTKLS
jgi:hypothetical protein